MKYPGSIQNLIEQFTKLPTVGRKTAERYVFYLLKKNPEELQAFAQAIAELKEKTAICQTCFAIAESDPCSICRDEKRDRSRLMIVADSRDLLAMEAIKEYNGLYHVLGGCLDALEGIKPETLNIEPLLKRLKDPKGQINEIILATNPDMKGETTAIYLKRILTPFKKKVTRLAKGLPIGADLEYADEMTLSNAFKYRNEM